VSACTRDTKKSGCGDDLRRKEKEREETNQTLSVTEYIFCVDVLYSHPNQ